MRLPTMPAVCVAAVATAIAPLPSWPAAAHAHPAAHGPGRAPAPVLAAAPALAPGHAPAAAPAPACGERDSPRFPLRAELRGGPSRFPRGGYWRAWHLELRNTTRAECRAIHPVVVLADRGRALRPDHIRLEFYDERAALWRAVRFETTGEDENVGVLDGAGFKGFAVPSRRSVTAAMRVRFTEKAPTGPVTANVTTVQRREGDGDWVGQSGDVSFRITQGPAADADADAAGAGTDREPGGGKDSGSPVGAGPDAAKPGTGKEHTGPGKGDESGPGKGDESGPGKGKESGFGKERELGPEAYPQAPALAETGHPRRAERDRLLPIAGISLACLLGGFGLVALTRRLRR